MVIFHSYVSLPEGNCWEIIQGFRHEPASLAAAASPEDFPPKVAVLGAFKKKKNPWGKKAAEMWGEKRL